MDGTALFITAAANSWVIRRGEIIYIPNAKMAYLNNYFSPLLRSNIVSCIFEPIGMVLDLQHGWQQQPCRVNVVSPWCSSCIFSHKNMISHLPSSGPIWTTSQISNLVYNRFTAAGMQLEVGGTATGGERVYRSVGDGGAIFLMSLVVMAVGKAKMDG